MARRVTFQPAIRPGPLPILQDAPLPSQKTWENMMSRLKNKYGRRKKRTIQPANKKKAYQAKLRAMVLNPQKKKTIRPANKKKAYQAKLRAMVLKPPRKRPHPPNLHGEKLNTCHFKNWCDPSPVPTKK